MESCTPLNKGLARKFLATVIQRIMSKHQIDDSDIGLLSDAEKEELMNSLEDAASVLQKKSDDIDISKIKEKYNT